MRWIIRGEFVAVSPISIHTGNAEDDWPDGTSAEEVNDLKSVGEMQSSAFPVQGIELDALGRPFLPATAIKGLVRAKAAQRANTTGDDLFLRLFGDVPALEQTGSIKSPTGGLVEFRNARVTSPATEVLRPALRGKTEISEGTRTADEGQLRHDRVVAPGVRFSVDWVLSRAKESDVSALLALLSRIDGASSDSAIGSSTSQGDGRIKWDTQAVLRFGAREVRAWLAAGPAEAWSDYATVTKVARSELVFDAGPVIVIPLEIYVEGHFLVSALGSYINDENIAAPIRRPYRTTAEDTKTALLPGASLDGALRAQARRIFRTISGDGLPWARDDADLPPAFQSLFGSADRGSLLEPETLLATGLTPVRQEFVAIDRFSGGQSESKKFALEAFEKPELKGKLRLHLMRRSSAALSGKSLPSSCRVLLPSAVGLLSLCLKDLATGDIPLGHGTRKGYGGVRKVSFDRRDWKTMLDDLGCALVKSAAQVPGFEIFEGLEGRSAVSKAIELLHVEARAWAERRKAATSGEVT